jgi:hypothetical protein
MSDCSQVTQAMLNARRRLIDSIIKQNPQILAEECEKFVYDAIEFTLSKTDGRYIETDEGKLRRNDGVEFSLGHATQLYNMYLISQIDHHAFP